MKILYDNPIGEFKLLEMFNYYDGPQLFSCRSRTDQIYLTYWADETDLELIWFYIPISEERYNNVKNGEISILECIKKAEDKWIWELVIPLDGSKAKEKKVFSHEIEDYLLPGSDYIIKLINNSSMEIPQAEDGDKFNLLKSKSIYLEAMNRNKSVRKEKQIIQLIS